MDREDGLVAAELARGQVADRMQQPEPRLGRRRGAEVLLEDGADLRVVPVVGTRTGHEETAGAVLYELECLVVSSGERELGEVRCEPVRHRNRVRSCPATLRGGLDERAQ